MNRILGLLALLCVIPACATVPTKKAKSASPNVTGVYVLQGLPTTGAQVALWLSADEGERVRVSALGHVWSAKFEHDQGKGVLTPLDRKAPTLRFVDEQTLESSVKLGEQVLRASSAGPWRFVKHADPALAKALSGLAEGRKYCAVKSLDEDERGAQLDHETCIECSGAICTVRDDVCSRASYALTGWRGAMEEGLPATSIVLQAYSSAKPEKDDCRERAHGDYQHFARPFTSLLARLESDGQIKVLMRIEGGGTQAYAAEDMTGQTVLQAMMQWDAEMSQADEDAATAAQAALHTLQERYKKALEKPELTADFLAFATAMNPSYWRDDLSGNIRMMEQLIRNLTTTKRDEDAERVFDLYVTHLIPLLELNSIEQEESATRIAEIGADMLIVVARRPNRALFATIHGRVLGGERAVEQSTHGRMLFNLACYYALQDDKKGLLKVAALALAHGKTAQMFREDGDFKAYQQDAEFKKLLAAHEARGGAQR